MLIDLFALLIVGALALLGWRSGFVRQIVHWLALAGAAVLAPNLGLALIPYLQPQLASFPQLVTPIVSLVVAWLLLFIVFDIAGVLIHRLVKSSKKDSVVTTLNKVAGAVFGGVKGITLVVIVGTGLVLLQAPVTEAFPRLKPGIENSYALAAVRSFNPMVAVVRDWGREHLLRRREAARAKADAAAKGARKVGAAGAKAAQEAAREAVEAGVTRGGEAADSLQREGVERVEEALEQ